MKKVLFLLVLVMGFGINASAQNHFDIKAGIGAANISDGDDADALFSWKAGVGYEIRTSKLIGIEPSVMVARKGTKIGDTDLAVTYAEIPVMCNFHVGAGWVLGAGVFGAFKLDGGDMDDYLKIVNSEVKGFDAGVKIGVKHDFDNGLLLGLDGTVSGTSFAKDAQFGNYKMSSDSKHITACFVLGYSF